MSINYRLFILYQLDILFSIMKYTNEEIQSLKYFDIVFLDFR